MKDDKIDIYDPLLSDDEFTALIDAEYRSQTQKENQLEKQKIWNRLQKRIHTNSTMQSWLPLAAVAMLLITLMPVLFLPQPDELSRIKGTSGLIETTLSSFILDDIGNLSAITTPVKAGDTIVFKTKIEAEGIIAFGYAENNQIPTIRFVTQRTSAGKFNLLKREGRTFGYAIEDSDTNIRFCAIAADNIEILQHFIDNLTEIWNNLTENNCITITRQ